MWCKFIYILLSIFGPSASVDSHMRYILYHSRANVIIQLWLNAPCGLPVAFVIYMNTWSKICDGYILSALKNVRIIIVKSGTRYYPPVRLRCLYISNPWDQAAGLQSWSTQRLAINRLRASGEPTLSRDFHVDMACGTGVPTPSHLPWFDKWFYIKGLCTDLGGNWLEVRLSNPWLV